MDNSPEENSLENENTSFQLILENPSKVYCAGEMVRGTSKFVAQKHQQVQKLSAYLRGEFYYNKDGKEISEQFFFETSPVDYRGAGEGNVEMEFCLVLRPDAESSLATPLGGIRYAVLSAVDFKENGKLKSSERSELISVNGLVVLPAPRGERKETLKERDYLFCNGSNISGELRLDGQNFLCGGRARASAWVGNESRSALPDVTVSLVQVVERKSGGRKITRAAAKKEVGAILPGEREAFSEQILIPPLPPTSSHRYFKISYMFTLEILRANGRILKLKIPIVVGNVPHNEKILFTSSVGALHGDTNRDIQCRHTIFPNESDGFKPLYITYVTED